MIKGLDVHVRSNAGIQGLDTLGHYSWSVLRQRRLPATHFAIYERNFNHHTNSLNNHRRILAKHIDHPRKTLNTLLSYLIHNP